MNEEQNTTGNSPETGDTTDRESSTTDSTAQPQPVADSDNAAEQDDYYEVDHSKKDVISTIGDGEMQNEGLAGAEDLSTDIQSSQDQLPDEQDAAELPDSEG